MGKQKGLATFQMFSGWNFTHFSIYLETGDTKIKDKEKELTGKEKGP